MIRKLPPEQSEQARLAAGAKAVSNRRERAALKQAITNGEKSIFDAINDPRDSIRKMRVKELLDSTVGVGSRRAFIIMSKIGISPTRRIGGLGPHQIKHLRNFLYL